MGIVPISADIRRRESFQALFRLSSWRTMLPSFQGKSIPVVGQPSGWDDALENGMAEGRPDGLCALWIVIAPQRQRTGLSRLMLEHMRQLAAPFGRLVAPVRPTEKDQHPLMPISEYAVWRRADGELRDPWLRTHERLGGRFIGLAEQSMRIEGRVAEWEAWTGLRFSTSGDYIVPGALTPVHVDCEADHGVYLEPNVWMEHLVAS